MDFAKLEKFIDKQGVAIIASVDEDGVPNMKAMLPPRKRVGLKTFYFTTNTSSQRVRQYQGNPKASIYFYRKQPMRYRGLMLQGTMEVLHDDESKRMIWKTGDKMYYPEGVTDPDYCVLKFTAHTGRYYENLVHESFAIEERRTP